MKNNAKVLILLETSTQPTDFDRPLHLGPLYILSYLESKGIVADFVDRNAEPHRKIDCQDYDIVGFSVTANNVQNSLRNASALKKTCPRTNIVFGGPFASAYPVPLIQSGYIDAVAVGEGEEAFYEYVSGWKISDIKGLYYISNGEPCFTGRRVWRRGLDALPFPAIHRVDLSKYFLFGARRLRVSSIMTSRGCPFGCSFCFHNMGYEWRERTPANVVDEMEWQVKTLGVRELSIVDDNFTFNKKRAAAIFDEILRRRLKVALHFGVGVRPDCWDVELLKMARAAGLWILTLAPETGDPETLKSLHKKFDLADVEKAVQIARSLGIATDAFFLYGVPGETPEVLKRTLAYAEKLNTDFLSLHHFIPFPETRYSPGNSKMDLQYFRDESYLAIPDTNRKVLRSFYRRWYFSKNRILRMLRFKGLHCLRLMIRPRIWKGLFCTLRQRSRDWGLDGSVDVDAVSTQSSNMCPCDGDRGIP
jgi:radical SAM superfamily enzyme YgiQ (UPF0313 family)